MRGFINDVNLVLVYVPAQEVFDHTSLKIRELVYQGINQTTYLFDALVLEGCFKDPNRFEPSVLEQYNNFIV